MAGLLALAAASAQAQSASGWSWTNYGPAMYDLSCTTVTGGPSCVAVGQQGMALRTSRDGAQPLAWSQIPGVDYPVTMSGVSCRGTVCLAVTTSRVKPADHTSRVYRSTDGGATWPTSSELPSDTLPAKTKRTTRSASAVGCDPTGDVCFAVGASGGVWRSADGGRAWAPLDPVKAGTYRKIDCPAADRCVAIAGAAVDNPTLSQVALLSGSTVTPVDAPGAPWSGAQAIGCDSATRCVVSDITGHFSLLDVASRSFGAVQLFPVKGTEAAKVTDLSCPAANTCVGLATGIVVRTTNLTSGTWQRRPNGDAIPFNFKQISCVAQTCTLSGDHAAWEASSDLGVSWAPVNQLPSMDTVDCTTAVCLGGGGKDIGVSTNDGTLWTAPVSGVTNLDIKYTGCFDSGCVALSLGQALFTTDLRTFDGRYPSQLGGTPPGPPSSCVTLDLCVALNSVTVTTRDGARTPWSQTAFLPGMDKAITCLRGQTAPVTCVGTVDDYLAVGTMQVDDAGRARWTWTYSNVDADLPLTGVACSPGPNPTCTAVGAEGEFWSSDPTDPSLLTWTQHLLKVDPKEPKEKYPVLSGVACPAAGVCVIGGDHGDDAVLATTDDNWATFSSTAIPGIESAAPKINGISCTSVTHCVTVGDTAFVGVRGPAVTPQR